MIDLVIPMVFPQDAEWQRTYAAACGGTGDMTQNVRYRSWGTEALLVQCCMKYMPWVRRIHLLLASESQAVPLLSSPVMGGENWKVVDGHYEYSLPDRRVRVGLVFHREFIPAEYLPCFSSPCIEMFLHRIPGLSEYFIYSNDDVFPLSPLQESDFFRAGHACQSFYETTFPASPNIFHKACLCQQTMLADDFGKSFHGTWLKGGHSMAALLKSSCEEVWQRYGTEILKHLSPKRRSDRDFNQYLFSLYQYFTRRYVVHVPRRRYVGPATPTADIAGIIRDPDCGILCLNDNGKIRDWELRAEIVRREIAVKVKN